MPPAARITDQVAHPAPPILTPGPGSPNVLIGFLPPWRGIPLAAVGPLQAAKTAATAVIQTAEAAAVAAAPTPGGPAARAAAEATKMSVASAMASAINAAAAAGADKHMCVTPLPTPPHGIGVVINGSATVLINNLPACRMGDTILEAIGPPNTIVRGELKVLIGP